MALSNQERLQLEINAGIKLIQAFVNTDTSKASSQEILNRVNFLISGFHNTLVNIKNRKKIIKDENTDIFNQIDRYFKNLGLAQPYIIIERLTITSYEVYIEGYDHILLGTDTTIKKASAKLLDQTQSWYAKQKRNTTI